MTWMEWRVMYLHDKLMLIRKQVKHIKTFYLTWRFLRFFVWKMSAIGTLQHRTYQ